MFQLSPGIITARSALDGVVGGVGTWVNTYVQALDIDSGAWNGNNLRQNFNAALLTQSGSKFRITLQSGAGAEGAQVASMHAGHSTATYPSDDFDGTQVPVTVLGSGSFTVPANSTVVTDAITYAFDETKHFLVAFYFNNAANDTVRGKNVIANVTYYFKASANETSTATVSGYTTSSTNLRFVTQIEVFTP